MRKLIILILACLPVFGSGNLCLGPTGSTSGTWTGATWTNCSSTYPGDGDFAVWRSTGTLTINADIGTSGGGGIKTIRIEAGTVTVDTTAARTITFGSTGTDPIGSGTNRNPGADASMHGLFVAKGTLNLVGTQANPVTITTADGSSPTYIHHDSGDVTGCTAFTANVCNGSATFGSVTLAVQWADIYRIGTNVSKFQGIFLGNSNLTGNPTVTISNSRFTSPYNALYVLTSTPAALPHTITSNYFTGTRSADATLAFEAVVYTALTVTDNTETSATSDGYLLKTVSTPQGATIARNAVYGDVANRGVAFSTSASTSTGGNTYADNLCVSAKRTATLSCITPTLSASDSTTVIRGNVMVGLNQGIAATVTSGASIEYYNNWCSQYIEAWNGQGCIITYNPSGASTAVYKIHNNVWTGEDTDSTHGLFCLLAYTTGSSGNNAQIDHNVCNSLTTANAESIGLGEGQTGANGGIANSWFRSNISTGGVWQITDGNTHNTWASGALYQSAGVHHNLTYAAATLAYRDQSGGSTSFTTGFDNGTTHHPNALYGDLTVNPSYFASARRPWTWASWMGGTGTSAYLFAELAKRSGWGGAYNIAISSNPIQDMRLWLFEGFMATNLALKGTAHDAGDIGAVTITKFNTPGGIGSGGAAF